MDDRIKKSVCPNCWRTVFSVESFNAAWKAGESRPSTVESSSADIDAGYTYDTPSWAEMQLSINRMCEWCDLLCEELLVYHRHVTKTEEPPPNKTFRVAVSWTPSWHVYTTAEDHAARYITERGVLDKIDSPESYALALQRIRECESQHVRCPRPARATLPTRVIDCADPSRPRLFITEGAPVDYYVALSYVWGEDQPHRTTSSRLASYTKCIDTSCIPKTIRDAIRVTHTLGIRYLWVDAFCIIQDSKEDKANEIARIRTIFREAYVTIIAANAGKRAPVPMPGWRHGDNAPTGGRRGPREPVNTRAWCLEERVLSTRALWYCSHTLQYECQTAHVNVDGNQNMSDPLDGVPRLPDCVFTPELSALTQAQVTDPSVGKTVDAAWRNMLGLYTRRALTKPRDRLLAFSGVVEYFHRFWFGSRYLAGLWEHQMPGCLLWYQSRGEPAPRPEKYRAPSWSWASVDGEISSLAVTYTGAVCTVIHCYAEPKWDVNPYGEVTAGALILNAPLRRVVWDPVEMELFEVHGVPAGIADDSRSERGEIGFIAVDAAEQVAKSTCEVTAAVLVETSTSLLGILIIPVALGDAILDGSHDVSGTFRRVGWFTAPFCDKSVWLGRPPEIIGIV
ncbi:hypothetical protein GQX73_g309 [Xylaria multiplex]|uniref:Heterokaryon incompatibility domain-containing protein n=1 Tax=Xylaria multiplex TaxID=323545 RepID=A0A7C8IVB2_9PEZI|nr:hypothetical protein GQX73_g309 [Xylaria multiplex]